MQMHRWTDEEVNYLAELVTDTNIAYTDVMRNFNRHFDSQLSLAQVMRKLDECGLHTPKYKGYVKFPQEHIDFLKANAENHTCTQLTNMIEEEFGKKYEPDYIRRIANSLGLDYKRRPITTRTYTFEQLQFIEERASETYGQIADEFYEEFGIELLRGSVGYAIKRYNMERNKPPRLKWTDEKDEFLKTNSKHLTTKELVTAFADNFNEPITETQVRDRLHKFDLKPKKKTMGECAQTSIHLSSQMHELIKNMAFEMNISNSKFIRDSITWFIDEQRAPSDFVANDLHRYPDTLRKNYFQAIRIPVTLQEKVVAYIHKHNYKVGDVYLQAILDYSDYIESPVDSTKYDAENWL